MEKKPLLIYPNPTLGVQNITLPQEAEVKDRLMIYDMQGRLLSERLVGQLSGVVSLDIGKLSSGMYVLRYISKDKTYRQSFVKEF